MLSHVIRMYDGRKDLYGYRDNNGKFTAELANAERMTEEKGKELMKLLRHKKGLHKLITVKSAVLLAYQEDMAN